MSFFPEDGIAGRIGGSIKAGATGVWEGIVPILNAGKDEAANIVRNIGSGLEANAPKIIGTIVDKWLAKEFGVGSDARDPGSERSETAGGSTRGRPGGPGSGPGTVTDFRNAGGAAVLMPVLLIGGIVGAVLLFRR